MTKMSKDKIEETSKWSQEKNVEKQKCKKIKR